MLIDGERLKHLLRGGNQQVLLCAPFIKAAVIKALFKNIHDQVHVKIITRWHPAEVAAGVSDLEVYELSNQRPQTELFLLDELHAKLYMADGECLVGSANLTATALGWTQRNNVELLINVPSKHKQVVQLLMKLAGARPATYAEKTAVEEKVAALPSQILEEGQNVSRIDELSLSGVWFPRCATPDKLFEIYSNPKTEFVVSGTLEDGLQDLSDLGILSGLNHQSFTNAVSLTLEQMPGFMPLLEKIPKKLTDEQAIDIISALRPDQNSEDAKRQWKIIRDWIDEFFHDKFEVAAESFVVRIKS